MSDLESRLRRLEQKLIELPSADEYLDAENRQRARAWRAIAEEPQRFPGFLRERMFTDWDQRILLNDTPEQRERDRQTIETWRKARGIDPEKEAEKAKERLLAMLEVRAQQ
jgi:hypothetical protein